MLPFFHAPGDVPLTACSVKTRKAFDFGIKKMEFVIFHLFKTN